MAGKIGLHEGHGGRVELAVVEPDAQYAVADDCVLVIPHVAGFHLPETEQLVEA